MTKKVIDIKHILKIIDNYIIRSVRDYSEEPLNKAELDLNMLCLELNTALMTYAESVETYAMQIMTDSDFINHMSSKDQQDYNEYLIRDMYRKIGDYLYEHKCGRLEQSEVDQRTHKITTNLQVSVVEESQLWPVLRPDIDSACTGAPSEEMLNKLREIKKIAEASGGNSTND